MAEFNTIIDYIIEQSNRYDIKNLQYEDDIKFNLNRLTDKYINIILNKVTVDIKSVYIMQKLLRDITDVMNRYTSECKKIMMDIFYEYYNVAYDNTDDLIALGEELSAKHNLTVKEQKSNEEYDEETIEYIQKHAFELLTGHSWQKVEKIRAELGNLFLRNKASKANVRNAIEKILNVNKSKAEEIAQTELSRAYNYGILKRLRDYESLTGENVQKYWHGFKYSANTCEYCKPRIGNIYDINDESEVLPAHVRCRCVWLPILNGWNKPLDTKLISRANMLNTAYNKDMMYTRINNRLGINYAKYMSEESMVDYLSGDRSNKVEIELNNARNKYINDKIDSFDIAKDNSRTHMSNEFNQQMNFWKRYVAGAMADNDKDALDRSYTAIQGVMVLQWNATQLDEWNKLLDQISKFR